MNDIAYFFAGAFLCNCLPHLNSGLQGKPFPTPFAKPPGRGDSSPLVNFLWGSLNLAIGTALLIWKPLFLAFDLDTAVFVVGFVLMGASLAHHFGNVQRSRASK